MTQFSSSIFVVLVVLFFGFLSLPLANNNGKSNNNSKQGSHFQICSEEGLREPAQKVQTLCNAQTHGANDNSVGLCSTSCRNAICNVMKIFRDCRTEVQATVDLLYSQMDSQISQHCHGHHLSCPEENKPKLSSSSASSNEPKIVFTLLALIGTFAFIVSSFFF